MALPSQSWLRNNGVAPLEMFANEERRFNSCPNLHWEKENYPGKPRGSRQVSSRKNIRLGTKRRWCASVAESPPVCHSTRSSRVLPSVAGVFGRVGKGMMCVQVAPPAHTGEQVVSIPQVWGEC